MKDINEMRESILDSMEKLKTGKMDVATANAIANLGNVVIKTAETELKVMRMAGIKVSSFIPLPEIQPELNKQIEEAKDK